jgi:hypothetical protein
MKDCGYNKTHTRGDMLKYIKYESSLILIKKVDIKQRISKK